MHFKLFDLKFYKVSFCFGNLPEKFVMFFFQISRLFSCDVEQFIALICSIVESFLAFSIAFYGVPTAV